MRFWIQKMLKITGISGSAQYHCFLPQIMVPVSLYLLGTLMPFEVVMGMLGILEEATQGVP